MTNSELFENASRQAHTRPDHPPPPVRALDRSTTLVMKEVAVDPVVNPESGHGTVRNRVPKNGVRRRLASVTAVGAIALFGIQAALGGPGAGPLPFIGDDDVLTNAELIEEVGRMVELPADEQPVIATIENVDELQTQDGFYVGAENGDKLLVYATSSRALIYSPQRGEIIKDGTVSK